MSALRVLPIRHLIVLVQENISFDHYFGTYPWAANGDPVRRWVRRSVA